MALRIAAGLMLLAFLGTAQQAPQKQVKNQQEFDLYTAARNEQDPAKKLAAIDEWKAKFPDTELSEDRNLFYLSAYLGLENGALAPNATPTVSAAGEKAAHTVIENLDAIFAAAMKPATTKDADWATAQRGATIQSHWTLATVAMARKDNAAAESELHEVLTLAPTDSNVALLLSRVIIAQGKQDRYPEAIFQVARAASEAPAAQKESLDRQLQKMYEGYHGELAGHDQVKDAAAKSPLPQPGWTIQSVEELIAPETVNTMPRETIAAYRAQGKPELRMEAEIPGAAGIFADLQKLGINMAAVAEQLEKEGVKKFIEPFDKLQASIEERRVKLKAG